VCNATNATATPASSTVLTTTLPSLPDKGEEEKEHHYSMTIFFILLVLGTVDRLSLEFIFSNLLSASLYFTKRGAY